MKKKLLLGLLNEFYLRLGKIVFEKKNEKYSKKTTKKSKI